MKNTIIKILEKPKFVVPAALILALVIGFISYGYIGQSPKVKFAGSDISTTSANLNIQNILGRSTATSTKNSVDLSFPKTGRLGEISVTVGSKVKKGDILASLEAGDSLGAVNQAKGTLELAKAQYASMDVQYENAKRQQDTLVQNAYRTLLSSNLAAVAHNQYSSNYTVDDKQIPLISGSYTCDKEGSYEIIPYNSGVPSGYSFNFTGLESGTGNVTYFTPQAFGTCGLFIQFPTGYNSPSTKWVINIPNVKSASYTTNKNAYDLAVTTRSQVLSQLEANLGKNGSSDANIAQAAVDSAQGTYEIALAAYRNNLIMAPIDGTVTFIDSNLKTGQSVNANKTVITIIK
jgi:multidrug efflux pump subunit AcrA (membrane-fusion protein)